MKRSLQFLSSCAIAASIAAAPLAAPAQSPAPAAASPALGSFTGWGLPPSCGDFLAYTPPPASAPAPWLAFLQAAQSIKDYTVTVHEVDSSTGADAKSEDRVLKFAYALPCYGYVSVVSGRDAGAVAVWHGGHRVQGEETGSMHVKAIIPDVDPRVTDLLGLPIYVLFIPYITSHLNAVSSSITAAPGPAMAGKPTDAVTFTIADPSKEFGLSKVVLYLDSATHLVLGNDGFDAAGKNVLHSDLTDTVINPGLPASTFNLP